MAGRSTQVTGRASAITSWTRSSRTSIPCCSILEYIRNHSDTIVSYPDDFLLLSTISSEDDVVIVYRVLDLRQNPESIRDYLKLDDQPEQR